MYDYLDVCKIEELKLKDEVIECVKKMVVSVFESVVYVVASTTVEVTEYLCFENMVDVKMLFSVCECKEL